MILSVRVRPSWGLRSFLLAALLVVAAGARPAAAQSTPGAPTPPVVASRDTIPGAAPGGRTVDGETPDATREELTHALTLAERRAADGALPAVERTRARERAAAIARRLEQGDLRVGDRFVATLVLDSLRRDEIVVREGRTIELGALPPLSVAGVLRSELVGAMTQHLRRFFRNPEVRVQPVLRISISGGVTRPGPYSVLPDLPLVDMLGLAGGPIQQSITDRVEVVRDGKRLLDGKRFQRAVRDGRTVSEAGLRSGDEVKVPIKQPVNRAQYFQIAFFGVTALIAVLSLIRASYQN